MKTLCMDAKPLPALLKGLEKGPRNGTEKTRNLATFTPALNEYGLSAKPGSWLRVVKGFDALCPTTGTNSVYEMADGPEALRAMADLIRTATGPTHFVYLLNGWMPDDRLLIPGDPLSSLRSLLTTASVRGVEVRAMLQRPQERARWPRWKGFGDRLRDTGEVHSLNALDHGAAVLESRPADPGCPPPKILIVHGSDGLFAFCGGAHVQGGQDVQCLLRGPVAADLLRLFLERWSAHPVVKRLPVAKQRLAARDLSVPAPGISETTLVRIGRTEGEGDRCEGRGTRHPRGDAVARDGVLEAIEWAQEFIGRFVSIEEPYSVATATDDPDPGVTEVLTRALSCIQALLVVPPEGDLCDRPPYGPRKPIRVVQLF